MSVIEIGVNEINSLKKLNNKDNQKNLNYDGIFIDDIVEQIFEK